MTKTALIFTTEQGHETLAKVMAQALRADGWKVVVEVHSIRSFLHRFAYQYAAFLMRGFSLVASSPFFLPFSKLIFKTVLQKYAAQKIEQHSPDLVCSSVMHINPALESLQNRYRFAFFNLITDPRSFLPFNPSPGADINGVFDHRQAQNVKSFNSSATTAVMGWLVSEKFEQRMSKKTARKQLGLHPARLTFLISSGSLGNAWQVKLFWFFFRLKTPLQVVFITGNNTALYDFLQQTSRTLNNQNFSLVVKGYVNNLETYMHAADLVIGKAGPNTIFESVATLTPFFATNYAGFQERENFKMIEEYGIGFTAQTVLAAEKELTKIIAKPQMLQKFQPALKKLKAYNQASKKQFVRIARELVSYNAH